MDGSWFDALTRSLASAGSRRRLLGGLAAGWLGAFGLGRAEAAACRGAGRLCREDANCCSGLCGAADDGRRRCVCPDGEVGCHGQCVDPASFLTDSLNCGECGVRCPRTPCAVPNCTDGVCGLTPIVDFSSDPLNCGACGVRCPRTPCSVAVCAAGVCGLAPDEATIGSSCDDGNSCTTGETCQADGTCGGGSVLGNGVGCANGGRCANGACLLAYPNCGGACSANVATPDINNMCWGAQNQCVAASCDAASNCPVGSFCGFTNTCGNGFEGRCFTGCII